MTNVELGDRFAKIGAISSVWVVEGLAPTPHGLPQHVFLVDESDPHHRVTMSISALSDGRMYRKVKE
jgi:hypothetical protein